jgi:hypothetical protein
MSRNEDASRQKEAIQTSAELQKLNKEVHELDLDATAHDVRDMDALGLAPLFKRRFKFVAMVGFCSTVVVAWQNTLTNFGFGLYDGGTGGIFWTFIFSLIASIFLYLSLCELASWYVASTFTIHVWTSKLMLF